MPESHPEDATLADRKLAAWLADHTDTDLAQVEHELDLGERRRIFVVDELLDAGLTGAELLDRVVRCTGMEPREAAALISARGPNAAR